MKRFSPLFLFVSLALAADNPNFWNVQLTSDSSNRYMVNAQMATGSAAQNFSFVLTTGTPYMTIAGNGCGSCGGVNSYNEQGSTTVVSLQNSANISLVGGGSTSGPLIKENCFLHAANGSSWNYPNQTIIMSNQSSQLYEGQTSGLLGLASGRGTNNSNVSIIGGIFGRNPARPNMTFGLALHPPNSGNYDNAGNLHWLGIDPNAYSCDITWTPTTFSPNSGASTFGIDRWRFETNGNTVNSTAQDLPSTVDPYYVNMFFPSREALRIHASIDGSSPKPSNDGQSIVYAVPCDSSFTLSITIGGKTWPVDQTVLVQKSSDGTCVSNIQGWADPNNNRYLLGSAFLSSVYVVHQISNLNEAPNDQIGFACRANPQPKQKSIIGPIVGGVVGGVGCIAIISVAVCFWIRKRDRRMLRDILDSEDRGGNVGRFVESKPPEPFPFTPQSAVTSLPTSPTPLLPAPTSGHVSEILLSPNADDNFLPPSYDQTYPPGPSNPSQQGPNLFPGHARKN